MSTYVMGACWPLQMTPTAKAVLMSLADNANDHGECWPGLTYIGTRTCLGRTAIIEAMKELESLGHLVVDRTAGRVNRYTITPKPSLFQPVRHADPSASRTRPPDGPHPSARRTTPVRQTDPNRKEPSSNRQSRVRAVRIDIPDWLPADAWSDWAKHRKAKRGQWTERAQELNLKTLADLRDAGHDPRKVIDQSIANGWTGLFPVHGNAAAPAGSGQMVGGLMALEGLKSGARA